MCARRDRRAGGALALARAAAPARGRAPAALGLALASLLAIPRWASVRAVEHNVSDTNRLGVLPPASCGR